MALNPDKGPGRFIITFFILYTAVLLGFIDTNSSVILTEGGENQKVCVDIKPEGLPLDPFDYIPLTIRTESLGITFVCIIVSTNCVCLCVCVCVCVCMSAAMCM